MDGLGHLLSVDDTASGAEPEQTEAIEPLSVGPQLAVNLSKILQEANVTCVLWGDLLLTAFGVPSIAEELAFVLDDAQIKTATQVLLASGVTAVCPNNDDCCINSEDSPRPRPSVHVHTLKGAAVSLYKQSEALWALSPLELRPMTYNLDNDVVLASEIIQPGRRGHLLDDEWVSSSLDRLLVPSAHRLIEAFILLLIRDRCNSYHCFWMAMVIYVLEYVEPMGLVHMEILRPWHRKFLIDISTGGKPMRKMLNELEEAHIQWKMQEHPRGFPRDSD